MTGNSDIPYGLVDVAPDPDGTVATIVGYDPGGNLFAERVDLTPEETKTLLAELE